MKKITLLAFVILLAFSLVSCTSSADSENSSVSSSATDNANTTENQNTENDEAGQSNVLVAYFSVTNNTKRVAQSISDYIGSDIYEITPSDPYTSADIDYNDQNSRTSIEMNDPGARPEISGSVDNMYKYDVIFLGYPIWWSEAPRIINTFLESYDFSGKTIVPFCTSGGSGIDGSVSSLKNSVSGAEWKSGMRFSSSASEKEITDWVNGLDIDITLK